jgi:hypothetical protein
MMLNGELKCTTWNDIIMLLKSSHFIAEDLCEAYRGAADVPASDSSALAPSQHTLVLKRWEPVNPASEFRCYVAHGRIIGAH